MEKLGRNLLCSVGTMEDGAWCLSCAIPEDLRSITTSLGDYCRERVKAAERFLRRYRNKFAVRFFHWIASSCHFDLIVNYFTQLWDCQKWVNVAIKTMTVLLLSGEATRINSNQEVAIQEVPRGLAQLRCRTHLPTRYTWQDVQQGRAEIQCRTKLRKARDKTQIEHIKRGKNRRKMVGAKVNLDALEEFTERILHDESGPSSQESLYFAPLQSRQKHRNTHHSPDPIPRHRNHVERPQEVPILPTETAPRLRPNTVLSKDGRQRHRQPSSQRREYNAASENTKTQRQDTESRRTRQNSPGESSRNELVEQQISVPRTSLSTSRNRGPHDGLPRLPIQHPVENPRPSSLWQRQESDLILERTASEREEPKVMRRSRRPPNHETENRQAEEQAQPQRRPILDSNREYVVERPRHRIPEKTINDHSLLSDVYSESRRQNPQSRSRSKAPSLSGVYSGTDVTTNTHCNTRISVHERPISRRANTSNECRPAPSLYYDQHPAERSQTPPRSRRPSFSQNSDVQTTTDTRRYTSTRTAAVNKPSPPRGLSGIPQSRTINTRTATVDRSSTPRGRNRTPQSRAPKPADRDTELAQGAQQTSTRSSVCSDDSGVGMSTRWSRSADPVPASPTSRPSQREEELTGRHAQPSMSRASSRCETWSTGGDSGVFMSGSEDSARESSAPYRRPDRVKDRYYPPASNKDVEKRQRRRTRTSRSRSSSRNYDSSARVSRD